MSDSEPEGYTNDGSEGDGVSEQEKHHADPYVGYECLSHPALYDDECEHCVREIKSRNSLNMISSDKISQTSQHLASQGIGINGLGLFQIRVDLLLDNIMDPRNRARFEAEFCRRVLSMLSVMEQDARKQRLMHGVQPRPGSPTGFTLGQV